MSTTVIQVIQRPLETVRLILTPELTRIQNRAKKMVDKHLASRPFSDAYRVNMRAWLEAFLLKNKEDAIDALCSFNEKFLDSLPEEERGRTEEEVCSILAELEPGSSLEEIFDDYAARQIRMERRAQRKTLKEMKKQTIAVAREQLIQRARGANQLQIESAQRIHGGYLAIQQTIEQEGGEVEALNNRLQQIAANLGEISASSTETDRKLQISKERAQRAVMRVVEKL